MDDKSMHYYFNFNIWPCAYAIERSQDLFEINSKAILFHETNWQSIQ